MAIYKPYTDQAIGEFSHADMYRNQRILSGTNEKYLIDDGVFFIDTIIADTSVTIRDGKNQTVVSGVNNFTAAFNPIRCDYGVQITGSVIMVKGYAIHGILPKG